MWVLLPFVGRCVCTPTLTSVVAVSVIGLSPSLGLRVRDNLRICLHQTGKADFSLLPDYVSCRPVPPGTFEFRFTFLGPYFLVHNILK